MWCYTPVNMTSSLSSPQAEILEFYKDFARKNQRAPSIREVASSLNREPSNIHYHLKHLEQLGLLVRTGGYRGVRLVSKSNKVIPLLGTVSCGEPISIFEETEEYVHVPENMLIDGHAYFALRAKGNSMINAGISDGDTLVIRKQTDIDDGDIAVVATGDPPFEAVTLKTVYHRKEALLLKPENDQLEPYIVKKGQIRGKLVGSIRTYGK
ncbi:MAG: lexA repressor [Candidatus Peregrinibacteria bacterium Greene0416_62]|nr:MAG: lexA repressor [Candidatus Peregrinibacteria bacterium Greene0416_62]TSC99134.1 MAG: lexA repressor [Candidatus Peregrinibacteria bacterium Greene1014_49]